MKTSVKTCAACLWFDSHGVSAGLGMEVGYCRRHAPVRQPATRHQFPKVTAEEWCGEFKALPARAGRPASSGNPGSPSATMRRPSPVIVT